MYINFPLSESYGLIPEDVIILQLIFQNKFEDHGELLEKVCTNLHKYEEQGFVKYINGTKKDSPFKLIRLSDKGNRILEEIQVAGVTNDDLDLYQWLESVYKKEGKDIGNVKKVKSFISQFRVNSGIERNHLAYLCSTFIKDEKEMEYSKRLEYLFFKPANVFTVKFDIEGSRLYQYYLKRKEFYDAKFLTIKN